MAKVDATASSGLGSRFDVSGYPTIKIIKKGEPVDYDGARTEKGVWGGGGGADSPKLTSLPVRSVVLVRACDNEVRPCRSYR